MTIQERMDKSYDSIPYDGCWIWNKHLASNGYGRMRYNGKMQQAHRVMYEVKKGPIPKGMNVLHKCDVKDCINPDHLFLGTQKDNMKDMYDKGRANPPKGESHPHAKVTDERVRNMRALARSGELTVKEIAGIHGISACQTYKILAGEGWKHVKETTSGRR